MYAAILNWKQINLNSTPSITPCCHHYNPSGGTSDDPDDEFINAHNLIVSGLDRGGRNGGGYLHLRGDLAGFSFPCLLLKLCFLLIFCCSCCLSWDCVPLWAWLLLCSCSCSRGNVACFSWCWNWGVFKGVDELVRDNIYFLIFLVTFLIVL